MLADPSKQPVSINRLRFSRSLRSGQARLHTSLTRATAGLGKAKTHTTPALSPLINRAINLPSGSSDAATLARARVTAIADQVQAERRVNLPHVVFVDFNGHGLGCLARREGQGAGIERSRGSAAFASSPFPARPPPLADRSPDGRRPSQRCTCDRAAAITPGEAIAVADEQDVGALVKPFEPLPLTTSRVLGLISRRRADRRLTTSRHHTLNPIGQPRGLKTVRQSQATGEADVPGRVLREIGLRSNGGTSHRARRPSARAVPGRFGGLTWR
jgi:hypothetical protein